MTEPITQELRKLSDTIKALEHRIIRSEYEQLKQTMTARKAFEVLAKRHSRSEDSIDAIVYPRKTQLS